MVGIRACSEQLVKKFFENSNINRALALRQQLSNIKMIRANSIASYLMKIFELRDQLSTIEEMVEGRELFMMTLSGLPPSWEAFIQSISGGSELPKFDQLWADCTQEEARLVARGRLHGSQHEESQALTTYAEKGKGKGRKKQGRKDKGERSDPIPKQKEDFFTNSALQMS